MVRVGFEWDERKDADNLLKHGVPFALAQFAFGDPKRVIAEDSRDTSALAGSARAS